METNETPFQAAVKPGLIVGLISMAVYYLAYFIDSSLLAAAWFGFATLVISFVLIIIFGRQYRAELGGFMSFGSAFNFSFLVLVISGLIGLIGQILLFQVIDPALPGVLTEAFMKNTLETMEKFGASPDAMDPNMMDEMKKSMEEGFTVMGQIKSFGMLLIFSAILALILGAILKKKDTSTEF
jgi:hypothetical protein